jgi:hypothetical protein
MFNAFQVSSRTSRITITKVPIPMYIAPRFIAVGGEHDLSQSVNRTVRAGLSVG